MSSASSQPKTAASPRWSANPDEPLLAVRDLCVEYLTPAGPVCAADHVSFTLHPGEIFGLAGESGSGKSTVAHALMRTLHAPALITGGSVRFNGLELLDLDAEAMRKVRWSEMAMVFQSAMNALNPVLSIGEQIIDVIQTHRAMPRRQARLRAAELLEIVGIDPARLDDYPHQLSGGMRQRTVIAIALALEPQLLIMDEPTTALDVVVQKDILQQLEALQRQMGFAVLFITHDLSLLVEFATRIGVMYAGQLVELAPAHPLFDTPLHPYTQGLMHSFPKLHGPKVPLTGIPGNPPDLARPPSGCRFHPRCAIASARCTTNEPPLLEVASQRFAACHEIVLEGGAR